MWRYMIALVIYFIGRLQELVLQVHQGHQGQRSTLVLHLEIDLPIPALPCDTLAGNTHTPE